MKVNKKALLAASRAAWNWPKGNGYAYAIFPDGEVINEYLSGELSKHSLEDLAKYG